jgi:hypothetical protein
LIRKISLDEITIVTQIALPNSKDPLTRVDDARFRVELPQHARVHVIPRERIQGKPAVWTKLHGTKKVRKIRLVRGPFFNVPVRPTGHIDEVPGFAVPSRLQRLP